MIRDLILCLDLASIVGWALFTIDGQLVDSGVWEIESGDHDGDRWASFRAKLSARLFQYRERLAGVAMERPVMYGKPGQDWTTGRVMFGQAAIVEMEAVRWMLPTLMIPPSEIKSVVTGNGNASKQQVITAIEAQLGQLSTRPGGRTKTDRERRDKARSDEADARGVGLVVLARYSRSALRERRFEVGRG
jgi:Holliday junction resolvasome RuvABC endonuclease subunit